MDSQTSFVIRLLIFSGRPDPEWTADEELKDALSGRLREAFAGEESNPAPAGGLGYRGFLIRESASPASRSPGIRVFRGVVSFDDGRRTLSRRDVAGVEEMLLADARRRGYGDDLDESGVGIKGRTPGGPTAQA